MTEQTRPEGPPARHNTTLWNRFHASLPYLVAAFLFGLGLYALYHLLSKVDINDVADQMRATPWSTLALAFLATLGGYLALVGYDWSALRYIGKPLPVPVVVAGGLMAYAFGNTVGLSAVSGGAVRYRIYSGLGLDGYDVAAVSTFAAVSYGVAATLVGLGALAAHPAALSAVVPIAPHLLRWLALAAIAAVVVPLVVASWRKGELRFRRFSLRAPTLPVLAGQVLFSLADIALSAVALYLLLPPIEMGFFSFLAVFAAATMAGILSHVPGGVGVFETVVIAAMPAGTQIETVAAGLLLYRFTYYIVPFVLALIVLALYEGYCALGGAALVAPRGPVGRALAATRPAFGAVAPLAPLLLAVMIFGSGLWMSFSALIPRTSEAAEAAEALFPLAFVEGSALLSSALGAGLIVLALGISRRSLGAWLLSLAALAAGMAVSLMQGLDYQRAVVLGLACLILLPFRGEFNRRTRLTHSGFFSPGWIVLVAATVASFGFVFFFANKSTPYAHELWWQFAMDQGAPRALRAGLLASLAVGLATLFLLLRAPRFTPTLPDAVQLVQAEAIAMAGQKPDAGFALTGDKTLLFADSGDAFLMFAVQGRSWIALGGPVGAPEAFAGLAWAFVDAARHAGARPVFYEVGEGDLPLMLDLGMNLHKLGEEAVIDLATFALEGPARKSLRAAHARAQRDGLTLEVLSPPHDPALIATLRGISDDWLAARNAREKGFSVGRFDPGWLNRWPVAVVRHSGRIVAFANLLVTDNRAAASIDMMRHSADAPGSTMEFLFTDLMLRLREQGYHRFSLGMAPLSGLMPDRSRRLWDRFGAALFRHGGNFYNFAGLRAFKEKFDPAWHPHYLAVPSALPPLLPLADAAVLIGGKAPRAPRARRLAGVQA
ncbi:bifunctional lysylphosphatidylglycerol flippase/synthetase MprF [Paracoccaceae bacterium Fryx2]|nr:bifunctional lysylphosphatidylglycerol flippase/synthetase MprF [Paracoccaceae bacterium Fryx2]